MAEYTIRTCSRADLETALSWAAREGWNPGRHDATPFQVTDPEGFLVGCLEGPDKTKGAPIYILKDDQIVSTLMPKEDLGLSQFTHVHNATMVKVGAKLYVIAQAWNPGDFAIFEQAN